MKISRGNDVAGFGINFVDIVLRGCNEDILDAIIEGVNEWLRVYLLESTFVVTRELGCPELSELCTSHNRRVHIMSPARCMSQSCPLLLVLHTYDE